MHPLPVHKSRIDMGRSGDGMMVLDSLMVQSSVSGRGISTGGRTIKSRPPNGWEPVKNLRTDRITII